MASNGAGAGTSGGGIRPFDFGSDDVLCSYDDFDSTKRADPYEKELNDNRMLRPLAKIYEPENYPKEDVLSAVEKCMKKYADNLLRSLDGIGSRLSQLEIYCYKLERSIGEFRSDMLREQEASEEKLKSLEKQIQGVHKSVQLLRDRQELAETQKELAKLQNLQNGSTKKIEDSVPSSAMEQKKLDEKPDEASQQLALVLPKQMNTAPLPSRVPDSIQGYKDQTLQQPAPVSHTPPQDRYVLSQAVVYYPQHQAQNQESQIQPLQPELQYMQSRSQLQEIPAQPQQQPPQAMNQTQPAQVPQYSLAWAPQSSQQVPPPAPQQVTQQQLAPQQFTPQQQQQPALQQFSQPQQFPRQPPTQQFPLQPPTQQFAPPQPRPPSLPQQFGAQPPQHYQAPPPIPTPHPSVPPQVRPQNMQPYQSFPQHHALNSTPDTMTGSMPMQAPYAPQPMQHNNPQRQQQIAPPAGQTSYGPVPPSKGGYGSVQPYAQQANAQGYNPAYTYPSGNASSVHGHLYGEMIEKAVDMGYPREQVMRATQRMVDSGQQIDLNALLDRLNDRGW